MAGPLVGIKVVDITSVLMGPYATQALADFGAEIIKVEAPGGDVIREIGPTRHEGMGAMFLNSNRGKRSIVIDLKHPAGQAALLRLVRDADLFVYNMRPQAMNRLGLSYEAVSAANPKIIYAGMFGFNQDGPYAARPAYDDLIQGASGLSNLIARAGDDTPRYVPHAVVDRLTAIAAVNAMLAALLHRARTGRGQRVDIPMFETMVSVLLSDHMGGLTFDPPLDAGGYDRQLSPSRHPYRTADGYIAAMIYTDKQWRNFFRALGREAEMDSDPRYASLTTRTVHSDAILAALVPLFETRTTAEWQVLLDKADIPALPLNDLQGLLTDPHLAATGFFVERDHPSEGRIRQTKVPATWSDSPTGPTRHAPRLGEHTAEILREAGYSADEIAQLIADGAAATETVKEI